MTKRDEALKKLMGLIDNLDDLVSVSTMTDFEGVLAVLSSPCAYGEPLLEVKGWLLGEVDEGVGGGHIITLTDEPVEGCDDTAPVRVLVFVDEPQE